MKQVQYINPSLFTSKSEWDRLSLKEKADIIRVGIDNGLSSVSDIKKKYNEFATGGDMESEDDSPIDSAFIATNPSPWDIAARVALQYSNREFNHKFPTEKEVSTEPAPLNLEEIKRRQRFMETGFKDNLTSPVGAKGRYQVTDNTLAEYTKKTGKTGDLFDPVFNEQVRDWYINEDLEGRSWITKGEPSDSVKYAKKLAAYNYGPTNTVRALNRAKNAGADIYNSWEWLEFLPKETQDYINFIERNKDVTRYKNQAEYEKAVKKLNRKDEGGPLVQAANEFRKGGKKNAPVKAQWNEETKSYILPELDITPSKPGKFMQFLMQGAMNGDIASGGGTPWFNTATGYKVKDDGTVYQDSKVWEDNTPEDNLRKNLLEIGKMGAWETFPNVVAPIEFGIAANYAKNNGLNLENGFTMGLTAIPAGRSIYKGITGLGTLVDRISSPIRSREYSIPNLKYSMSSSSIRPTKFNITDISEKEINDILEEALQYKNSPQYAELVKKIQMEVKARGYGEIPTEAFYNYPQERPKVVFKELDPEFSGNYDFSTNTIYIAPTRGDQNDIFHEALHWLRIGEPEIEVGPKYTNYIKSKETSARNKLLNILLRDKKELSKYKVKEKVNEIINDKVKNALNPEAGEYLRKVGELQANGLAAGRAIGLKPFQEYPGIRKELEYLDKAREYNPHLWDLNIGNTDDPKSIWKILTGNYTPIIATGLLGTAGATLLQKQQ